MEVRVVCGLLATMAILAPISAFSSVDLPALGRPRMETKPEFMVQARTCARARSLGTPHAHLGHAQLVAGQDIDVDAVALDGFAGLRHAAEPFGDQSADGGGFEIFLRMEVEQIGQARHIETAGDDVAALAVFLHVANRARARREFRPG